MEIFLPKKPVVEGFGTFCLVFAGTISGASMNPARSLAPALLSWQLDYIWIYLVGPLLGTVFSVPLCRYSRKPCCCRYPFARGKC